MTSTIVDYGLGNLYSVDRALRAVGSEPVHATKPDEIESASLLVIPGVGSFKDGMEGLRSRGFVDPITAYAKRGRPILGICLGMQLLLSEGEEFGPTPGLGLIPGKVIRIEPAAASPAKIPHVGWNSLTLPPENPGADWNSGLLQGINTGEQVYFVHSYEARPSDPAARLADTPYGGRSLSAVIGSGNIYGCQFHPEKSGPVGLTILKNLIAKVESCHVSH